MIYFKEHFFLLWKTLNKQEVEYNLSTYSLCINIYHSLFFNRNLTYLFYYYIIMFTFVHRLLMSHIYKCTRLTLLFHLTILFFWSISKEISDIIISFTETSMHLQPLVFLFLHSKMDTDSLTSSNSSQYSDLFVSFISFYSQTVQLFLSEIF